MFATAVNGAVGGVNVAVYNDVPLIYLKLLIIQLLLFPIKNAPLVPYGRLVVSVAVFVCNTPLTNNLFTPLVLVCAI